MGDEGLIAKAREASLVTDEASALEKIKIGSINEKLSNKNFRPKLTNKQMNDNVKERVKKKTGRDLYANDCIYEYTGEELDLDKKSVYLYIKSKETVIKMDEKEYNKLKSSYATWFWVNDDDRNGSFKYVTDQTLRRSALDKLVSEGIDTIYIAIPLFERKKDVIFEYRDFVRDASDRNISVSALVGDPGFIVENQRKESINTYMDNLYNYNIHVNDNEKIKGIHYDVEAHGLWETDDSTMSNEYKRLYIEFAKLAYDYAKEKDITVEYDINVNYNKIEYTDLDGSTKNVGEEICKYTDEIVLMDYREDANGVYNNLIEKGHNSLYNTEVENNYIDLANKNNINLVVGLDLEILSNAYDGNFSNDMLKDLMDSVSEKINNNKDKGKLSYYYTIHSANVLLGMIEETGSSSSDSDVTDTVEEAREAGYRMSGNTVLKDSLGNDVMIPDKFKVAKDSGINVVEGIVIEDNDIVNKIGGNRGNQYVWVPVGNGIKKEGTNTENIILGRYTFDNNAKETLVQNAIQYTSRILIDSEFSESSDSVVGTTENGLNTSAMNLKDFIDSVNKYGGYYIARYEASYGIDGKANSKVSNTTSDGTTYNEGTLWNYVTEPDAAAACRDIYNNSNYTTDLMNSYTWDTTILYIQKFSDNKDYSNDTSANSGGTTNTGVNGDEWCKINDLGANAREWTTENSTSPDGICVGRGCSARQSGIKLRTRYSNTNTDKDYHITFRPILYLN